MNTRVAEEEIFWYTYGMKSLQLSSPHIIATVGVPGAGKSFFAQQFADMFGAPLITGDQFLALSNDPVLRHQAALAVLPEVMKTRQTIVFEGSTDRRTDRAELVKQARHAGYKVLFVWVQTDEATARQRSAKQRNLTDADYDQAVSRFSAPHHSEPYLVISGRHTYSTQAKAILKRLTAPRPAITEPSELTVPPRPVNRPTIQ